MKSRIVVMMIVEVVGWVETAVGTTTMIQNARLATGGVDHARICRTEIPIAVDTIETGMTTEIGEMTEKVCIFLSKFQICGEK